MNDNSLEDREENEKIARRSKEKVKKASNKKNMDNSMPQKKWPKLSKNVMQLPGPSDNPKIRENQCNICHKYFVNHDKLKRHKMSHSDSVDSTCNLCGAPMKYDYNMRTHLEKCFQNTARKKEQEILRDNYPDFLKQLDAYAKDPCMKMPSLPPGYTMDNRGMIYGHNPNLKVDLSTMIPGSSKVTNQAMDNSNKEIDDEH